MEEQPLTISSSLGQEDSVAPNTTSEPLATRALSRRSLINSGVKLALGASTLGPLLSACGGSSGGSTSSGPVTIQFAALVDQTGELQKSLDKFNQQNQGKIKVDYLQLPPVATDQYSKFVTAFRSQSATPDVVQIDVTWPAQFSTPGWLAPLDQYVNQNYLKQFWPSAAQIGQVNGKLYGIQRYMDIGLLYYRTDLVDKYGGKVPQTRSDLESLANQIIAAEKSNGIKYGYLQAGKKIEAIVDQWLEFIWGAGGDIGKPGSLQVNGATQIDALKYMHDLIYTLKLSPEGTNTYVPNDILSFFSQGQAPFMRNWTFAYALANDPQKSKIAGKVGVSTTLASAANTGHGCTGGWVLGINAFSQHKDEAWKFIDYMLSKETQTSLSLNTGLISSRPDVVADATVQSKYPHFKQLATILNSGNNRPKLKDYNKFTTPLQAAINSILSNQGNPAEALNGVQPQVTALT